MGGVASGVGAIVGGMFMSDGISTGADTMSDSMCRAAIILSEAGIKSANLHAKIASEAIINSMKDFGETMDESVTRNTIQAMRNFDATLSNNTLLFLKHFDGNVDKLLELLTKESVDWQEVVMKVRVQLSNELWWAKATLVSVTVLFAIILFPMWLSPEQVMSVQECIVGFFVESNAWVKANVLKLIGFCVVVLITSSFLNAFWTTRLTILRMDAQRVLMLNRSEAVTQELLQLKARSVPVGTVVPFHADPVPLRELGWAVCDGTTPAHQEIFGAVLNGPTPLINDSRFVKGVSPDQVGTRNDDATTLVFGSVAKRTGAFTHDPVRIPTNGEAALESNTGRLPYTGSWGTDQHEAATMKILWDKPEVQPKSIGLTYIIRVK